MRAMVMVSFLLAACRSVSTQAPVSTPVAAQAIAASPPSEPGPSPSPVRPPDTPLSRARAARAHADALVPPSFSGTATQERVVAFVNDAVKPWYAKKREVVTEACDAYKEAIAEESDPAAKATEAGEQYETFVTFEDQWLSAASLAPDEWKDDLDLMKTYREQVCDVVAPMNAYALGMRARCLELAKGANVAPPAVCSERAPKYVALCGR